MAKGVKKRSAHPEVPGFFLIVGALFLAIASLTFVYQAPEKNWLGVLGYLLAFGGEYLFGLGIYLIPCYLFWLGVRCCSQKPGLQSQREHLYFAVLLGSSCMLLTLCADLFPGRIQGIGEHVIREVQTFPRPYAHTVTRYYLGGIPFYFLYADVPLLALRSVISPIGTALIFVSGVLVAFVLLTRVRLLMQLRAFGLICTKGVRRAYKGWTRWKQGRAARLKAAPLPSVVKSAPLVKVNGAELVQEKILDKSMRVEKKEELVSRFVKPPSSPKGTYQLPSAELLADPKKSVDSPTLKKELMRQSAVLEEALKSFGIEATVGEIHSGPTITSFEVHPSIGVKVQKIKALESDLALNMQAKSIRIIAPIPGKAAVGVEIPTLHPQEVNFKEMLLHYQCRSKKMALPILIGKAVNGEWVLSDLARMPHLLIAGATGSGKSVCINTIVLSLLMNAGPDELQLLMIDPKKVELTQYSQLPHMIAPVVTEAKGAYAALQWLVKEMQTRYELLKVIGVRNLSAFNQRTVNREAEAALGIPIPPTLPFIVAMIDEFADLMMVSSADIETPIARIAQMARAVGIHLILATQRPSREVITGIIKANITSRIAFKVANRINSQIILDEIGAESLLGNGDLLFLAPGTSQLVRAQGAYIGDEEIHRVIRALCQDAPPRYLVPSFDALEPSLSDFSSRGHKEGNDALYDQALTVVLQSKNASTTYLQRKLKIGYARAASLMDELEANGVISPQDGAKARRVLRGIEMEEGVLSEEG